MFIPCCCAWDPNIHIFNLVEVDVYCFRWLTIIFSSSTAVVRKFNDVIDLIWYFHIEAIWFVQKTRLPTVYTLITVQISTLFTISYNLYICLDQNKFKDIASYSWNILYVLKPTLLNPALLTIYRKNTDKIYQSLVKCDQLKIIIDWH